MKGLPHKSHEKLRNDLRDEIGSDRSNGKVTDSELNDILREFGIKREVDPQGVLTVPEKIEKIQEHVGIKPERRKYLKKHEIARITEKLRQQD